MSASRDALKTFANKENNKQFYPDKQKMQRVDLLLAADDAKMADRFVKKIRDSHAQKISQLFEGVYFGQKRIGMEQQRLDPYKVASEHKRDLIAYIDHKRSLVGVRMDEKIAHRRKQNNFHKKRNPKKPFCIQYRSVKPRNQQRANCQDDAPQRIDGRLKRRIEDKDRPYA